MKSIWFLVLLVLGIAIPVKGDPGEPTPGFVLARLKYGGGGDWYSGSTANLLEALRERTTVPVARAEEVQLSANDPELFSYPFLYMNGHGNIRFDDSEVARLRRYLLAGGFLLRQRRLRNG